VQADYELLSPNEQQAHLAYLEKEHFKGLDQADAKAYESLSFEDKQQLVQNLLLSDLDRVRGGLGGARALLWRRGAVVLHRCSNVPYSRRVCVALPWSIDAMR
jgi:hypothetical protein